MEYELIPELSVTKDGAVRVVTFTRPDRLNAVNANLHRAISNLWKQLEADDEARAVVLTGTGRAFCVGGDMSTLDDNYQDPAQLRNLMVYSRQLTTDMVNFPLPVIAAVNGPAVGLGCTIALLCDIVLMADTAWLCDPHVPALGIVAGDGGHVIWPLLTSLSRAKEYLLTGDKVSAVEAERIGLANRVVATDNLVSEALALAHRIADMAPFAVQATKRALNFHISRAMVGAFEYGMAMESAAMGTIEHKELISKFLARSAEKQRSRVSP